MGEVGLKQGWQPIESAPRDGSFVFVGNGSKTDLEWWPPPRAKWDGTQWVYSDFSIPFISPTHWLPEPPAKP